jgi:starvation-inducible outer membrane lipoprotein
MRIAPVLLLALAGCTSIPLPHRPGEPAPLLSRKRVAAKRDPQVLVARDGTRCVTTEARFERARPGDRVWCLWTDASGRPETGES